MVLQHAMVTHQRVVLGLWRSDLDAVKLDLGLVVDVVTSKLLRSVIVAILACDGKLSDVAPSCTAMADLPDVGVFEK